MKVGDLVRSVRRENDIALVIGFKEVYEDCGNKYPIVMWLDNQEVDSCYHRHLQLLYEVISEAR